MAYTDGTTKIENSAIVIERLAQTETDVATFAGTGRVERSGLLSDLAFIFDGTTPPNSITYTITDNDGLLIKSGTITASTARGVLDSIVPVIGGLNFALSGNTTNNAKLKIKFYFIG